jgi:cytochrome P450
MTQEQVFPELDLAELNSDLGAWSTYRDLRDQCAVARSDQYGGYWALIRYDAVKSAAVNTSQFCSSRGATIPSFGNKVPALPTESDPPEHRKYHKLLLPRLRPDRVEAYADDVRVVTNQLIDEFIERGSADLMSELAHKIPPVIIARVLGLPEEDGDRLSDFTTRMNQAAADNDVAANRQAASDLQSYVEDKINGARGLQEPTLLSAVANAVIDGEPISHREASGLLLTLIVAGHETTIHGIGSALWLIAAHPEIQSRLAADPTLIPAAVEEALRVEGPTQLSARTVTSDVEVDGVQLAEGDKVGLIWGAANHDGRHFENPDVFDIDRKNNNHVAFGHGIHRCLGEHLARVELRVVVEEVLLRIPDYRLAGVIGMGTSSPMNRGPQTVPVEFTPHPRLTDATG